ncbi:MAG: hypothetical protein A3A83_04175 [Candidatus Doudnabacteria bacterium RIFCSPLOWO2_01_FULL_48_57]|uniref:Uncharacterized protein n=1 Tax=Candidatus Doudnabacteria bacterium RIFCSPLOWO2_02_FULL_48_13 TaxID=1817845 RepID=A0A1F5QDI5_9BACT|nr:MAG: hypothetical protein A3K05_01860 [Candidatus Doudnabacteria bacterium RIFCSPHIGHO2_01_48_18]OGE77347.1 MAG: hypothetical protein A2668_03165 [Candidatus Doudnabacteria bacterium RIFCSPHIGHO2_01_FULL_48_180]OGE97860.1 MAG: hypothetical protein A3A83_04175 [Candidatus Doudnabacteria bacterium RIFCSPLOWO2_01_FULL_48_57]OGE99942.1 MAG: hypothetical protein A3J05_04930 [Candidatus Doudnabacteria bacterium RIFCSPLOWO2_02_FULL_48_13]OGF02218.1 MAG: hypothetical protein A3G07_00035 [Candidatus 
MSRISAALHWDRMRSVANVAVKNVEVVRNKARDDRDAEKRAPLVTGVVTGGLVPTTVISLTYRPDISLISFMFLLGLCFGFTVSNDRKRFIWGSVIGSGVTMLLSEAIGLHTAYIIGTLSVVPARFTLMVVVVVTAKCAVVAIKYGRFGYEIWSGFDAKAKTRIAVMEKYSAVSVSPKEFYSFSKNQTDRARRTKCPETRRRLQLEKWLQWERATAKHIEYYARDLSKSGVPYKSALGIAHDLKAQSEIKLAGLR